MKRILKGVYYILFSLLLLRAGYVIIELVLKKSIMYPGGSMDFQWDSALLLRERINPYDVSTGNLLFNSPFEYIYGGIESNQFPSLLIFLIPFTYFSPDVANILWCVIKLILTFVAFVSLRNMCGVWLLEDRENGGINQVKWSCIRNCAVIRGGGWILLLILINSSPWINEMYIGQHAIFSCACLVLSMYFIENPPFKKEIVNICISGILLSFSYFKYTLTGLFVFFYIYQKWYKPLAVSIAIQIILQIFMGWWLRISFLDTFIQPLRVSTCLSDSGFCDLSAWLGNRSVLLVLLILGSTLWLLYRNCGRKKNRYRCMCLLLLTSLIVVYHRRYDYFVCLFPAFYYYLEVKNALIEKRYKKCLFYILELILFWFILYDDMLLKHIGIEFLGEGGTPSLLYTVICSIGIYSTWLYLFIAELKNVMDIKVARY